MEVDSDSNKLRKKLDLTQAADFFGMELITFHRKHHLFFNFFSEEGGVETTYLKKHLLETNGAIALQSETDYQILHPERCCLSGDNFCRSSYIRQILLEGIHYAKGKGIKAHESFLWHFVLTSDRKCCLQNRLTFEYTLFTLVRDEMIIFQWCEDESREYDIAPPKLNKVGRPRKYL